MASASAGAQRAQDVLEAAFAREARRGVRLAVLARGVAFALLWLSYLEDARGVWHNPYFLYRSALIAVALVSGVLTLLAAQRSRRPVTWCGVFLVADLLVIALLVFGWLPPAIADYPQILAVRQQDFLLFVVILCASVLPLSPRLAMGAGVGAAVIWIGAVGQEFVLTPGAMTAAQAAHGAVGWNDRLARISQPLVLDIGYLAIEAVMMLAIAALLMLGAREGRRRAAEAARAEAGHARFARFFPSELLGALGQAGHIPSRRGEAAILFADFDRSGDAPSLELLGAAFGAAEAIVLDRGGVLDRFAGDALMASFGALGDMPDAAARALACAERLLAAGGALPFRVAAVHVGPVVSGEVGSARLRSFGVVGDTVNTARRLLDWARGAGLALAVSGSAVAELPEPERATLVPKGEAALRGLDAPLACWSPA